MNIPPNGISTADAIAIQRFFLNQTSGLAQVGTHQFNPVNRSYSPLVSDQANQNFNVLILGDVANGFVYRPEGGPSQETVVPGAYTAIVRGNGRTTGVGLVEVYNIP